MQAYWSWPAVLVRCPVCLQAVAVARAQLHAQRHYEAGEDES